jgi:hypothetical protein
MVFAIVHNLGVNPFGRFEIEWPGAPPAELPRWDRFWQERERRMRSKRKPASKAWLEALAKDSARAGSPKPSPSPMTDQEYRREAKQSARQLSKAMQHSLGEAKLAKAVEVFSRPLSSKPKR